jgi:uncharacterized phage protein (TIGR02218 family)
MAGILEGPLTSVALCWRVERSDGAGLALTSHDEALTIGGTIYEAAPGMLPAAIQRKAGLESNGAEISGAITSGSLDEQDLVLGRWDRARVGMTAVDWRQPEVEQVPLMAGELGEIRLQQGEFKTELRGGVSRLEAAICPETSPECRAELGDKKCRVDLAGRALLARVEEIDAGALVMDRAIGGDFLWGRARFVSGANCGLVSVIVAVDGSRIELRDTARALVEPGDRIELRHGCDKSFATCAGRFANAENFRGEPHLPGNDLLTRYPGA